MSVKRVGDLELGQDLTYQRRKWIVERVGWGAMALIILGALIGLFGTGPFSSAKATAVDAPLSVEYDRFGRLMSPLQLRVRIGAGAVQDDEIRLWLDQAYLERVRIQHITPEPSRVEIGPERYVYVFQAVEDNIPTVLTFHMETQKFGLIRARMGLAGKQTLEFTQFIYP